MLEWLLLSDSLLLWIMTNQQEDASAGRQQHVSVIIKDMHSPFDMPTPSWKRDVTLLCFAAVTPEAPM